MSDRDTTGTSKVQVSTVSLEALEATGVAGSSAAEDPEEESAPVYEMPFAWRAVAGWL